MCGRVTDTITPAEFKRLFQVDKPGGLDARYNVAPTRPLAIVREDAGRRSAVLARWGLVPPGMTFDDARRLSLFNARRESVLTKPSFRGAFERRRCLVPVSSFYEWRDGRPHLIRRRDKKPLVLAGLWEEAHTDEGALISCTIVTTESNADVAELHDRMPVILLSKDWDAWLSGDTPRADAQRLLAPFVPGVLENFEVDRAVGNVRNEGAHLVERAVG